MSRLNKRRTRKEKETAKHVVKGQFSEKEAAVGGKKEKKELATFTAKPGNLSLVKRDIIRSLVLASFILGLEIMIYFAWSR